MSSGAGLARRPPSPPRARRGRVRLGRGLRAGGQRPAARRPMNAAASSNRQQRLGPTHPPSRYRNLRRPSQSRESELGSLEPVARSISHRLTRTRATSYKSRGRLRAASRSDPTMTSDYLPAALAILAGVGLRAAADRRRQVPRPAPRQSKAKDVPYECGSDVIGSPRARFEVKFYQVAIVFLVFDIETAFLYPWALRYRELSCSGALDAGVCGGRHLLLRPGRDPGVHGHPDRRPRLRLAQARRRVGVRSDMGFEFYNDQARRRRSTGRASSRCSSTRS